MAKQTQTIRWHADHFMGLALKGLKRKTDLLNSMIKTMLYGNGLALRRKPMSGPMIQKEARQTASKLGAEGFNGSNGWLQK